MEQPYPYTKNYKGKIKPIELKNAFLNAVDKIESQKIEPRNALFQIFEGLIEIREKNKVDIARPINLSVQEICERLAEHFFADYNDSGAARLPVLAIYAMYECMIREFPRFNNKNLNPLLSHTSADLQSGAVGDVEVVNDKNLLFEAVEVKHDIRVTKDIWIQRLRRSKLSL